MFGSLLNHLCRYANKNISVRSLYLICIISVLTTIYSLRNCSVQGRSCRNYSPKSFRLFWHNFRAVLEKIKMLFTRLDRFELGKNCALCLEYLPRPTASGGTQDLGHSFSRYGTPGWRIKYMYPAHPTLDLVYCLQVV